jgi:hypothetical protein
LFVVFASLASGLLLSSAVGSGSMSEILASISSHPVRMRLSILFEMVNSSAIVVLAVLLYVVLSKQNKIIALVALGWWLAEAIVLTLANVGAYALIPLSQDFVAAGAPGQSFYQVLGQLLYDGLHAHGAGRMHMWFYCIGGLLWYTLFYQSRVVPRVISLFGIVAVAVGFIGILLEFLGYDMPIFVYLPILPFELAIGVWLLLMGIGGSTKTRLRPASANGPG